jgi:hypothetical protein
MERSRGSDGQGNRGTTHHPDRMASDGEWHGPKTTTKKVETSLERFRWRWNGFEDGHEIHRMNDLCPQTKSQRLESMNVANQVSWAVTGEIPKLGFPDHPGKKIPGRSGTRNATLGSSWVARQQRSRFLALERSKHPTEFYLPRLAFRFSPTRPQHIGEPTRTALQQHIRS